MKNSNLICKFSYFIKLRFKYSNDGSYDHLTKEKILRDLANKQAVRKFEKKAGTHGVQDLMPEETCTDAEREIANQLNELWRRVKNFLSDLNDKGQPIILNKPSDSARLKFTRACERYSMGSANLPFEEVKRAFNTALL